MVSRPIHDKRHNTGAILTLPRVFPSTSTNPGSGLVGLGTASSLHRPSASSGPVARPSSLVDAGVSVGPNMCIRIG